MDSSQYFIIKTMTLSQLEELYYCSRNVHEVGLKIILVNDPVVREFYTALRQYTNTIKFVDANPIFRRFCSICWDIYREISCSPISPKVAFDDRRKKLGDFYTKIASQLTTENQLSKETKQLVDILRKIKNEDLSTLLIKVTDVLDNDPNNPGIFSNLFSKRKEAFLESLQCGVPNLASDSLLDISNLRKRHMVALKKLYNFGLPRAYDREGLAFLVRSPVAEELIFIAYSHEKNVEINQNGFNTRVFHNFMDQACDPTPVLELNNDEPDLPEEYSRVVRFKKRDSLSHDPEDNLGAWRIILGGGETGTYLDPESSHYTLDFKNHEGRFICTSVDETLVEEIDQESLMVFNTHGGGNMLVPVADSIMGSNASRYRSLQEEWKLALGKLILDTNENMVIWKLRHAGSKTANRVNLNNWRSMDTRKIAMKDLEVNFRAVLKVLGFEPRYEEFCEAVISIRDSHRAAGLQLISQLRNSLINQDISGVFESGYHIVGKEVNGPELTIFGIEEIIRFEETVPRNYLGKLFDIEEI
jgi:hypothetical protein